MIHFSVLKKLSKSGNIYENDLPMAWEYLFGRNFLSMVCMVFKVTLQNSGFLGLLNQIWGHSEFSESARCLDDACQTNSTDQNPDQNPD